MYGPSVVFDLRSLYRQCRIPHIRVNEWLEQKRTVAFLFRLWYFLRIMVLPWWVGGAHWLLALVGVPLIEGSILSFLFVVGHNFEGSDRKPLSDDLPVCWYRRQVMTTCSYGGPWASFLTGGLNYQLEHHLFPRMNSWHYSHISPIVRKICRKHQVPYVYFPSLWDNTRSMLTSIRR